jgi:hypothetical protein
MAITLLLKTNQIECTHTEYIKFMYMGADKSLARRGRKQATATEDFEFQISYL